MPKSEARRRARKNPPDATPGLQHTANFFKYSLWGVMVMLDHIEITNVIERSVGKR
jgi:hypothetical protein